MFFDFVFVVVKSKFELIKWIKNKDKMIDLG